MAELTREQLRRMQAGKARAKRAREREARARVAVYERWLKNGSVMRKIPAIPSDADYAIARRAKRGGGRDG